MVNVRRLGGMIFVPALACSTTAGSASYGALHAEYARSETKASPSSSTERDVTAGPVLDRADYIRAVLRSNPTLESARQGWRAALSRVRQAGTFEDPMVDVGVAPLSIGSRAPVGYEFALSQRLPWFGKRSLEASAAAADAQAAKSDYEAMRRELALSALALYNQYFVAVRALEINANHVELMRVMRSAALAQFEAGRAPAQDPLQAEGELAHMEHDAAVLASQRDVTVAQMNELLHRPPELPLPPPSKELPLPSIPDVGDAKHLEAAAVAQRTEIRAARHRAEAAQARADRADRDAYPDVTLSTSYNSMWDMPQHRWMVGIGFDVPIQTGDRAGAADESLAMRAQFESDAARMTDAARTQVFVALKQLQESRHVLGLFETRLLPVARDRIDAARAGFTASQNPFMAVVEAEKTLRSVELEYQMARAECDRRRAELDRALGKIPGLDSKEGDR
jgi:outer membrane protein, heavy metal efflux system